MELPFSLREESRIKVRIIAKLTCKPAIEYIMRILLLFCRMHRLIGILTKDHHILSIFRIECDTDIRLDTDTSVIHPVC